MFHMLFTFQLPPDKPIGETAAVVLLLYPEV